MNSLDRVLTTLQHKEPDRVPLFLLVTMHGAKELGISIKDYFSRPEYVVEGQLRMREKYRSDCLYSFFYAPLEVEAWGADVIYRDDGPPNSGKPFISETSQIMELEPPDIENSNVMNRVLETTRMLKKRAGDDVPIIGVVMSPFSLPVMQIGFDKYIELMYDDKKLFEKLMNVNEEFCVRWANLQIEAGATAICYFDPVSSATVIPRELYMKTGFEVAKRTIARIKGPTATHFASGISLPILNDVPATGTYAVGTGCLEDLEKSKDACLGKLTVLGNLNGIKMRKWSPFDAEKAVKDAIFKAGKGGGFILSDSHGEIPYQVTEEVLMAISNAVHKWGHYPLEWIDDYEK